MADKVYLGDIGKILRVSTGIDLTNATVTRLNVFKDVDNSSAVVDASVYGDATDGYIQYVIADGFLTVSGLYKIQAYVEMATGEKYYGNTANLIVYDPYR